MSAFVPFRGPTLRLTHRRRRGSPASVVLTIDQTVAMIAVAADFPQLLRWLERETQALREFMAEPEDEKSMENQRGDAPE